MALSKRVAVTVASLVLLALVVGAVGAVSASPDHEKGKKARTLTVVSKARQAGVVDLPPRGPSQGDMRVVNARLYDAGGTSKIGRVDIVLVQTDTAADATQGSFTYTLPGGDISAQGVVYFSDLSSLPRDGTIAISGGTGKYAGARGEMRLRTRGEKVFSTFRFVG